MSISANIPVLIFGEALIDDFPDQQVVGGAPFNVARTLAYFGCAPLMISRTGKDHFAELIRAEMQRFGMNENGMQSDEQYPTGRVAVTQENSEDKSSHRFDILTHQAYDYIDATQALSAAEKYDTKNSGKGLLYFGTLAQRHLVSRQALQTLLNIPGYLKFLDLNLREQQYSLATIKHALHDATILKINEDELQVLVDHFLGDSEEKFNRQAGAISWQPLINTLMHTFDIDAVVVTLGARGYAYFDRQAQFFSNGDLMLDVTVIDTVGGGDAFSAIFILGLYRGWSLALSLQRAHQFSAAICGVRGAVASDLDFYLHWENRWNINAATTGASA